MSNYDPRHSGAKCDECPLYTMGARPVPPKWSPRMSAAHGAPVPLVIVNDAPGANELKRNEPFVGAAGVKLDEMLWEEGLSRDRVLLITNALLCRAEVPNAEGRKRYDLKNWLAWWRKENALRKRAEQPLMANPFACCKPRLDDELARAERYFQLGRVNGGWQNLVVMPTGGFALGMLHGKLGKSLSVMKYRGSVLTEDHLKGEGK